MISEGEKQMNLQFLLASYLTVGLRSIEYKGININVNHRLYWYPLATTITSAGKCFLLIASFICEFDSGLASTGFKQVVHPFILNI